jgi:hypothetical protein
MRYKNRRIYRSKGEKKRNTIAINEGIHNENVTLTSNRKQGMRETRK